MLTMPAMDGRDSIVAEVFEQAPGGIPKLAETLGVTRQALYQWKRIPPEHVLKIEEITGIPAHRLRPDRYRQPVNGENPAAAPAPQPEQAA